MRLTEIQYLVALGIDSKIDRIAVAEIDRLRRELQQARNIPGPHHGAEDSNVSRILFWQQFT